MVSPEISTGSNHRKSSFLGAHVFVGVRSFNGSCPVAIDPFFTGLTSGVAGLIGDWIGGTSQTKMNQQMQVQAQQFNAEQTQKQMDFQREMSNSAYQRSRADMEAAGLNPMAMFGSGGPASTPAGGAASTVAPQVESPMKQIGKNVERVISSAIQMKTFEKLTDEIANLKSTNEYIQARTASEKEVPANTRADTFGKTVHGVQQQHIMPEFRARGAAGLTEEAIQKSGVGSALQTGASVGKKIGDAISPVRTLVNSAVDAVRGLSSHNFDMRWPDRETTNIDEFGNERKSKTTFKKKGR